MGHDRSKCDAHLGMEIHNNFLKLGIETPMLHSNVELQSENKIELIEDFMRQILLSLGLDLTDDSLKNTPNRVAKMYVNEIFYGLDTHNFPKMTTVKNKFKTDEMVLEKNINVMSFCEHHMLPIHGIATLAYIPKDKVIGLSKMNRLVEYFSKRPQVQERLTNQIFHAMDYIMGTHDIAVTIDARHYCVICRGIEDVNSSTITSKLGGCFKSDLACRSEFMSLAGRS